MALTGADGLSDFFLLPVFLIMMGIFGLVALPAQNFFSRTLERQADRFAMDITGSPGTLITVMDKLADMNLADREPSLMKKIFMYDHPPIGERIRMAEEAASGGDKRKQEE